MNIHKNIAGCLGDTVVELIKYYEAQPKSLNAQSMVPIEPYRTNHNFLMLLWNYSLNKNIVPLKEIRKASNICVANYLNQKAISQKSISFALGLPVIFGANLAGYYATLKSGYQANADIGGLVASFSTLLFLVPFLQKLNARADSLRAKLQTNILNLTDEEWEKKIEVGLFLADNTLAGKIKKQYLPKGYIFNTERKLS